MVSPALEQPVPVDSVDTVWTLTSDDSSDGRFVLSLVCSKLLLPSPDKPMSLARNRVKVGEVRGANKFPIVDEQESVLLRVQVLHDVTLGDGDPVTNALVDWETPEDDIVRTVTGAGGWASLLYTPKKRRGQDGHGQRQGTCRGQCDRAVVRCHSCRDQSVEKPGQHFSGRGGSRAQYAGRAVPSRADPYAASRTG